MIQRLLFIVFLFFLFVLEGTVFQWLVPDMWGANWTVIPSLSFIVVMMVAAYFGPVQGLLYGALFGLLHDLTFSHMIGGYLFSFAIVAYFSGQFIKQFQRHNVLIILTIVIGISVQITILYGLYRLFNVTQMELHWMVYRLLVPSVLANLVIAVLLLRPLKKWFAKLGADIDGTRD